MKKNAPKPIPFHRASLGKAELAEAAEAIRSGWITMGPKTVEFEAKFREYLARRAGIAPETLHAVTANSATAALHLALKAIGLKAGDEVIIPTTTFIATAEVVTYFGAKPVLCDVEDDTHNIDASKIEALITRRTKALIPVHFAGQPCDMGAIMRIARKRGLKVIEDAAHSLPSDFEGRPVGTIGDVTCFSFYATKTLAMGEGGMIVTSDERIAKHAKINRLHGISRDAWDRYTLKGSWVYEVVDNGYKYNTTDIAAGLGLAQLRRLDSMNAARLRIAAAYDRAFAGSAVATPVVRKGRTTCAHLYVIKVSNRDELYAKLREEGIGTSVHFIPVHKHPWYKKEFGYRDADYPVANRIFARSLSLPIFPDMTGAEVRRVAERVLAHAR